MDFKLQLLLFFSCSSHFIFFVDYFIKWKMIRFLMLFRYRFAFSVCPTRDNYGLMTIERNENCYNSKSSPRQRAVHGNVPFIARKRVEDDLLLHRLGYAIVFLLHPLEWLVLSDDPRRDVEQGVGRAAALRWIILHVGIYAITEVATREIIAHC